MDWKHYQTVDPLQKEPQVGRGLFGIRVLILHFKFQFSKSVKSSTFHIFLNLTYPLRKNLSFPKHLKITQKCTQNCQIVDNVISIGIWRRLKRDRDIGRKAVLSDVKTAFTFTPALNPRIFMPRQNGSRPRTGNLGRVKAVTSNLERTLRLSQSGLLLCRSVEAIFRAQGFRWDSTVDKFLFLVTMSSTSSDSEMTFDSEDSEIYYIALEDTRHEVGFKTMTTKLIYWLVFCWPPSRPASGQLRMYSQIQGGGCWQRIRANFEGQTRRLCGTICGSLRVLIK